MTRNKVYFASDAHLGLRAYDYIDREQRFVEFLRRINKPDTRALFLLGDIWDFWYEWKDTVPKGYVRLFAALMDLMDSGVQVYFCNGNHDVWTFDYFASMGIRIITEPTVMTIGSKTFCLGHGDLVGHPVRSFRIMRWCFHNKVLQFLFSTFVHPTIATELGRGWSKTTRLGQKKPYVWKGKDENIYKFALKKLEEEKIDIFIFGHLHVKVREELPGGAELYILNCWFQTDGDLCIEV